MNGPGLSLLQGGETIKVINTCLEREDEEEELEDERRRHEELGNLLQNAFDDLNEDDTTIDSTSNFQSNYGALTTDEKSAAGPASGKGNEIFMNHQQHKDQQQQQRVSMYENKNQPHYVADMNAEGEIHRLRMMLESRTNELRSQQQFTKDQAKKLDELQKRLLIAEAELERTLAAKSNTHELLVESKEKCSNLENTIEKIRNERKLMETEKNNLLSKLETTENLLCDVQRKYDMVERDLNRHNERNVDLKLKQMEERHRAATEILQERLQQISNKLDKKSSDLESMTTRYQALQNTHEIMLCEKASRINDLSHNLTEMQKRCEELSVRTDYKQDNIRLQKLVDNLQERIKDQEATMNTLRQRLEATTADLDIMDGVLRQYNNNNHNNQEDCTGGGSGFSTHLSQTQGCFVGSTPITLPSPKSLGTGFVCGDKLSRLKDELLRTLNELKLKREEARSLQQTINKQEEELQKLKLEENNNLVQINMLKDDNIRLSNRYKVLQEEYDALRSVKSHYNERMEQEEENQQKHEDALKKEMETLRLELNSLRNDQIDREIEEKRLNGIIDQKQLEKDKLQSLYDELTMRAKSEKDDVSRQMENLYKELDKHTMQLKEAQEECKRLKQLYSEAVKAKDTISAELKELKSSNFENGWKTEKEKNSALQCALQLAEVKASEVTKILEMERINNAREISDLKEKLEQKRPSETTLKTDEPKVCMKCLDYMSQLTKYEIDNLKLGNLNANLEKDLNTVQKELKTTQAHMSELNEQLKLCGEQENLIKELKLKAAQFEQYIRDQAQNQFSNSTSGVGSSTTPSSSSTSRTTPENGGSAAERLKLCDKNVGTSPTRNTCSAGRVANEDGGEEKGKRVFSPTSQQDLIKEIEGRMREELSEIFTQEISKMRVNLQESQDQLLLVTKEYKRTLMELKQRQKEVDVLKEVVVAEREKMQEILAANEQEYKSKLQSDFTSLEKKVKDEIQMKANRIKELTKELNERQIQIEGERKSMKAVMKQWEEQCRTLSEVENEWKQKFDNLQQLHETTINSWRNKYLSAKKMADNYKRYSEDKEAHMLKEYDRLKYEYRIQVANIEKNYATALEKRRTKSNQPASKPNPKPLKPGSAKKTNRPQERQPVTTVRESDDDGDRTLTSSNKENDIGAINA